MKIPARASEKPTTFLKDLPPRLSKINSSRDWQRMGTALQIQISLLGPLYRVFICIKCGWAPCYPNPYGGVWHPSGKRGA